MADRARKRFAAKKPAPGRRRPARREPRPEPPAPEPARRGLLGLAWIQFRALR